MAPRKNHHSSSKSNKHKSSASSSRRNSSKSTPSTSQSEADEETEKTETRKVSKHKSFGKFRCLIDNVSNPDSGLETECEPALDNTLEQQAIDDGDLYDSVLISSDAEIVEPVAMEYTDIEGESVEVIATEISHQLSDLHMYNEPECYTDDLSVSCEQEIEISPNGSDRESRVHTSGDENSVTQTEPNDKKPKRKTSKNGKNNSKNTKRAQSVKKNKSKNGKFLDTSDGSVAAFDNIRRSVRIKCKETSKPEEPPKSNIKSKKNGRNNIDSDASISNSSFTDPEKTIDVPSSIYDSDNKPVKVKSRWRRSSELEMENLLKNNQPDQSQTNEDVKEESDDPLTTFVHLRENLYLTPKVICKEAKKMACDCVLTPEEIARDELGCGDDCLNRLLMIECGSVCPVNERCSNKKFQKCDIAPCEAFRTDKKGLGVRATDDIPFGQFILEYVGEVIGPEDFEERATDYSRDHNPHHYFMALRTDAVIDATAKGNLSRFINHSCDPNAETQKWTVNGELRIGFFSKRTILSGEEITFDYQFQRYGKDAQKCLCEAVTCRGWLGAEPEEDAEEDDEIEEVEEVEEEIEDQTPESVKVEPPIVEEPPQLVETIEEKPPVLEPIDAPPVITAENEEKPMPVIAPVELPTPVEVKKIIKKEKKKIIKRKVRKEIIFENVDVDGEIEMLVTSGLKNQAHTLKLSRLMVRATEVSQRSSLLRILRRGELPCRRLFLDYHGLRLIYGWMNDAQQLCKTDKKRESLRLELLQTLATLPIPNKTMLQDSKVLPTVEKWSTKLEDNISGIDSESNSPKTEMDVCSEPEAYDIQAEYEDRPSRTSLVSSEFQIEIRETKDIRRSVGMDRDCRRIKNIIPRKRGKELIKEILSIFDDDEETKKRDAKPDIDYEVEIIALALKLLEEWAVLKEVFRIPKKERIEQMKEHEREADRVYKSSLDRDTDKRSERSTSLYSRYRILKKSRNTKPEHPERNRKHSKSDDTTPHKHINKHERRKMFAKQVEQRDMWRQHELQCMSIGADPRFTSSYDLTRNIHALDCQSPWQNSPTVNQGRFFNFNSTPNINMPPPSIPSFAPQPSVASFLPSPTLNMAQLALNNITRSAPPPSLQPAVNLTTNISNALASLITLSGIQQLSNISALSGTTIPSINQPLVNLTQPGVANTGRVPNVQTVITLPNLQNVTQDMSIEEDVSQVQFAGPIPPPVKLPSKWKCAKDKYGRPYYYHIKIRISQWEPPEFPPPPAVEYEDEYFDSTSSSITTSSSEASSTDESDDDDDDDDGLAGNKLLQQIRKKFQDVKTSPTLEMRKPKSQPKVNLDDEIASECLEILKTSSLDERLQQEFNVPTTQGLSKHTKQGLVTDIHVISPRTEEDKIIAKENLRRYKRIKQQLKRQKETTADQNKINITLKRNKSAVKAKVKDFMDINNEESKRIKEAFRTTMATNMVSILSPYRKRDCTQGKITNNDDFKHLARKLTLFVMLKQLKNCVDLQDLVCSDSVKAKAKVFVSKYMSKFGEIYIRPKDDADYY